MSQSLTTTNRQEIAKRAAELAQEIRVMRQSLGVDAERMAATSANAETFAMLTLVEKFTELIGAMLNQAPPTVVVTNEVARAPVTVIQSTPRFSTEETVITRGNNGEMLGSVTRVNPARMDGN